MVDSISQSGLRGIMAGLRLAADSAEKISSGFSAGADEDVVGGILDLHAGSRQVQASSKIVGVEKELDKAVLDILA